jgi:hypothetical protein
MQTLKLERRRQEHTGFRSTPRHFTSMEISEKNSRQVNGEAIAFSVRALSWLEQREGEECDAEHGLQQRNHQ